jgi:hypothetical protein
MSVAPAVVHNFSGLAEFGGWDHYSFNLMMSIGIQQRGKYCLPLINSSTRGVRDTI